MARFNELKSDTGHYFMDERELNMFGLNLLYNGSKTAGLAALKLNTLLYPASANVYDSYAEALRLNGKKEEAVMMYKESLQLNPRNEGARKALKELAGNFIDR